MLFVGRDVSGKLLVVVLWSLKDIWVMGSFTSIENGNFFT